MEPTLQQLNERVDRLEQELAAVRTLLGIGPEPSPTPAPLEEPTAAAASAPATAAPPSPPSAAPPMPPAPPPSAPRTKTQPSASLEENLVGTWFPRIGAVAILVGAGFAFKYAVDRGFIGPFARVTIGVVAGVAFLIWGYWTYRKGWERFAQAVTGGGVALLYLSTLAAFLLYELISAPTALVSLTVVVLINALLALFYNSLALALMATVGGFINPLLMSTSTSETSRLYAYIVFVDLAAVLLSLLKRWRPLEMFAFTGTWLIFAATAMSAESGSTFWFATLFFLLFSVVPLLRTVVLKVPAEVADVFLLAPSGIFYFIAGMWLLSLTLDHWQGFFVFVLAVTHLGAGLLMFRIDRLISASLLGMAIFLFTALIPIQVDGFLVPTGWAIKGVLLIWLSLVFRSQSLRNSGVLVAGLALIGSLTMLGFEFDPPTLLASTDALNTVIQIGALYFGMILLGRDEEARKYGAPVVFAIAASFLTLTWLTAEASAYFRRYPATGEALQFTVSAIWALYAAGLLMIGFIGRVKWPRMLAVAIFGVTMAKMAVYDLWLLATGYRVLAFVGLGMVLLLCSLMYHQFKEFILGSDQEVASTTAG
jgi:uncharacterized membrane protein